MSLIKYKKKRDFTKTKEPEGKEKSSRKELIFVVQKHDASHLHYDFRLEMEGVLKSWAIPKGPSMNPEDKRLAMMVEDHPYDYKDFEGSIPRGSYGAGNVIVWDNGTYTPPEPGDSIEEDEKKLLAGLHKGDLKFILKGKKLKGEFALVNMRKDEKSWLLLKKKDKYAIEGDILEMDKSVITGKKIVLKERGNNSVKKKPRLKLLQTVS